MDFLTQATINIDNKISSQIERINFFVLCNSCLPKKVGGSHGVDFFFLIGLIWWWCSLTMVTLNAQTFYNFKLRFCHLIA